MGKVLLNLLLQLAEKHPEILEDMLENGVKLIAADLKKKADTKAQTAS